MDVDIDFDLVNNNYQMIRVPGNYYNLWREIVWNMSNTEAMKTVVLERLKDWITSEHPSSKLCAFDEFSFSQAKRFGCQQGMYVIVREMTAKELQLSKEVKEGSSHEEDPQWLLELEALKRAAELIPLLTS